MGKQRFQDKNKKQNRSNHKKGKDIVHVEVETLQHIEDLIVEQTTQIIDELMSILRETIQQQAAQQDQYDNRDTDHYRRHQERQANPGLLQTRSTTRQEMGLRRRNNEQGNVRLNIEREQSRSGELDIDPPRIDINQGTQLPPGMSPFEFNRRNSLARNQPVQRNPTQNIRANVQTTMNSTGRTEAPVRPVQIATPQRAASTLPNRFRQVSYSNRSVGSNNMARNSQRSRPATGLGSVATAA